MSRGIFKQELLLAVAMSQYYELPLVHFVPAHTKYTNMLQAMRSEKYIEPTNELNKHYRLTKKGKSYLIRKDSELFIEQDKEIDKFIDEL